MPVYNAEPYLSLAIESILQQTFQDFEFIIVNDGSTDGSQAILDAYAKRDQRIKIVAQKNSGVVASANRAAELAQGEYIARMDADDVSLLHKLEQLITTADKHPDAIVICGGTEAIDKDGEFVYRHTVPIRDEDIKLALHFRNPIANGATLVKRSAFHSVGGFSDVFAEDCHLWIKLATEGKFVGTGSVVYRWRVNPTGLTSTNAKLSTEKELEYCDSLWEKLYPVTVSRRDIIAGLRCYETQPAKHKNTYSHAFVTDISKIAFRFARKGHFLKGIRQLTALMTSGKLGLGAALVGIKISIMGNTKTIIASKAD
jgi:glycosyltransferase involved in cell wall biosynthesis